MKNRKILSISGVITNSSTEVFLIDARNISKNKITKEKVIDFIAEIIADIRSKEEEYYDWNRAKEDAKLYDIFIDKDWDSMYQLFVDCYISPDKKYEFTEEEFLKLFPYFYSVDDIKKRLMSIKISDGIADLIKSKLSSIILDEDVYTVIYSLLYPDKYSHRMSDKIEKYNNL